MLDLYGRVLLKGRELGQMGSLEGRIKRVGIPQRTVRRLHFVQGSEEREEPWLPFIHLLTENCSGLLFRSKPFPGVMLSFDTLFKNATRGPAEWCGG